MGSRHRMIAVDDMPPAINDVYDMRNFRDYNAIVDAFKTMLNTRKDVMRVTGPLPASTSVVQPADAVASAGLAKCGITRSTRR